MVVTAIVAGITFAVLLGYRDASPPGARVIEQEEFRVATPAVVDEVKGPEVAASGVWAMDFTRALRLIFRTGDTIGGKTLKSFTLLKAVKGSTGVTRSVNDAGQIAWLATFTDKTTAIVVSEVP